MHPRQELKLLEIVVERIRSTIIQRGRSVRVVEKHRQHATKYSSEGKVELPFVLKQIQAHISGSNGTKPGPVSTFIKERGLS